MAGDGFILRYGLELFIRWCKIYSQMLEKEWIFDLLLGLNKDLDEVRGRLLSTKPFASICEVFAEVRREESRIRVMLTSSFTTESDSYLP